MPVYMDNLFYINKIFNTPGVFCDKLRDTQGYDMIKLRGGSIILEIKKRTYTKRKEHYETLLKKQIQTISFISILRFITFASGLSFGVFFYFKKAYYLTFAALIVATIIFLILANIHSRIKHNKKRCSILCEINKNSLKRLDNQWKDFVDTGEDFVDENHNYSKDLDIFGTNSLFQWINTCSTYMGREKLKTALSSPKYDIDEIYKRQEAIKDLLNNIGWSHKFMAEGIISENKNHNPEDLFKWAKDKNEFFLKPWVAVIMKIMPILTLSLIISSFIFSKVSYKISLLAITVQIVLLLLGFKEINTNLNTVFKYKNTLLTYYQLLKLIENKKFNSEYLTALKTKLTSDEKLTASLEINKLSRLVSLISDRKNIYYMPINILLLWDYQCLISLQRFKKSCGDNLQDWLEVIGEMESLNSLSVIAYDHDDWVMPKFQTSSLIYSAKKLGHPLLGHNLVQNDLNIEKHENILLITGSNMSGKSTLLRTAGINLVLAYSGAPVCAESFSCSIMDIYTCMRTSDNLEKNISSFYAELLRIKTLVNATKHKKPIFFLLDEIFKGTNSIDRHTGAKVLINKLSSENALGFVSTHDLELGDIADYNKKVRNYHLREYYEDDKLYFDYKLRPGISTTRNALYLMKMAGLEITDKNENSR